MDAQVYYTEIYIWHMHMVYMQVCKRHTAVYTSIHMFAHGIHMYNWMLYACVYLCIPAVCTCVCACVYLHTVHAGDIVNNVPPENAIHYSL